MIEYKKLSQLIAENSTELEKQLLRKKLPIDAESIQQLCVNYVERLTNKDSYYMKQLSLLEQDLLIPVLKVIDTLHIANMDLSKKTSATMTCGQEICNQTNYQHVKDDNNQEKSFFEKYIKEYTPALIGIAGGSIFGSLFKPSSWSVILFGSIISATIGKVLYDLYFNNKSDDSIDKNKDAITEYQISLSDIKSILKVLITVGECVDKVILIYRKHIEILQEKYEKEKTYYSLDKKYIEILECFQTVLGNLESSEKTPIVKDSIKQITNTLANHGYNIVHYNEQYRMYFKENTKEGDECIEEFKPAILRKSDGGRNAVLKGEVLISNNNK